KTKELIIVLEYAEGGSYNDWIKNNYKDFNWYNKIRTLLYIIAGLKGIHQDQKVHHDLHPGNILFSTKDLNTFNKKSIFISDMGLCEDVNNTSEEKNIYGVMPYMAPECLRNEPYTQAADIYSFGMIMYFTATGKQPFNNRAHDYDLTLEICEGIRPEINEREAPKCYIDLMKRCWNSNPDNRPNAIEIHELIVSFYNLYNSYNSSQKGGSNVTENRKQFKEAEIYRKLSSSFKKNKQHSQAIYTSRLLNFITRNVYKSECLDCAI
ncbi:kinase-like domain-containing protein, partial [Rhizophagus irregularis DAOM 181602=DAOM 197198]